MCSSQLEAAFFATTYRVEAPEANYDLRIGLPNPAFDAFLQQQGVASWGIITACNPGGMLTLEENAARQAALLDKLNALAWCHFPASNHADSAKWPIEPGFCVLNASVEDLSRLAAEFGQAAIVLGQVGQGGGRLIWIGGSVS